MSRVPTIGVMGSREDEWPEFSVPVGRLVAALNCNLLTGGGQGVMMKTSESFCETPPEKRLGRCIGILPTIPNGKDGFDLKPGYPNRYVEIPIVSPLPVFSGVEGQVNRNHLNILSSDVVIALAGNRGTTNEIMLAVQFGKPVILFRPEGTRPDMQERPRNARDMSEVEAFVKEHLALGF